jgi:hypothetical protein
MGDHHFKNRRDLFQGSFTPKYPNRHARVDEIRDAKGRKKRYNGI